MRSSMMISIFYNKKKTIFTTTTDKQIKTFFLSYFPFKAASSIRQKEDTEKDFFFVCHCWPLVCPIYFQRPLLICHGFYIRQQQQQQ